MSKPMGNTALKASSSVAGWRKLCTVGGTAALIAGILFRRNIAVVAMLRSKVFGRAVSIVGIIAGALDLTYCAVYIFSPTVEGELLAVSFIPAAGLFLMAWHIMTGWKLCKLGRQVNPPSILGGNCDG